MHGQFYWPVYEVYGKSIYHESYEGGDSVCEVQVYDAVPIAGALHNVVYAKINLRQFKAVNTTKGPWPLLDALVHIKLDQHYGNKDKNLPTHLEFGSSPSTHETHSLSQVTEVIRRIAIDLIGHDNLQGAHEP